MGAKQSLCFDGKCKGQFRLPKLSTQFARASNEIILLFTRWVFCAINDETIGEKKLQGTKRIRKDEASWMLDSGYCFEGG